MNLELFLLGDEFLCGIDSRMPLYDFHCRACDKMFELLVSCDATPPCPDCQGILVRQPSLPSAPGKSAGLINKARARATREGHFSHYAASERPKIKV